MIPSTSPHSVVKAVLTGLLVVLAVAAVARTAYWLLEPLVPVLIAAVAVGTVYWVIFHRIGGR